jgi:hypothetical protein
MSYQNVTLATRMSDGAPADPPANPLATGSSSDSGTGDGAIATAAAIIALYRVASAFNGMREEWEDYAERLEIRTISSQMISKTQ